MIRSFFFIILENYQSLPQFAFFLKCLLAFRRIRYSFRLKNFPAFPSEFIIRHVANSFTSSFFFVSLFVLLIDILLCIQEIVAPFY